MLLQSALGVSCRWFPRFRAWGRTNPWECREVRKLDWPAPPRLCKWMNQLEILTLVLIVVWIKDNCKANDLELRGKNYGRTVIKSFIALPRQRFFLKHNCICRRGTLSQGKIDVHMHRSQWLISLLEWDHYFGRRSMETKNNCVKQICCSRPKTNVLH